MTVQLLGPILWMIDNIDDEMIEHTEIVQFPQLRLALWTPEISRFVSTRFCAERN